MPPTFHINGPVTVKYNGITLGKCKEPIAIRPKVTWTPILVDGFGTAPAGYIFGGRSAVVECVLSEYEDSVRGFTELTQDMFPNGLYSILAGTGNDPLKVGELASNVAKILTLEETAEISPGNPYYWQADIAVISDPAELILNATSEMQWPISFLIIPDSSADLFSVIPSYIS